MGHSGRVRVDLAAEIVRQSIKRYDLDAPMHDIFERRQFRAGLATLESLLTSKQHFPTPNHHFRCIAQKSP